MWKEITPKKEEEIIEKVAQAIVKYDMELPALLFFMSLMPISFFGGQIALMFLGPYLPGLEYEYFQVFEKRTNVDRAINRIRELKNLKEKEKAKKPSIIERIRRKIIDR